MSSNRGRDTGPELALRRELHARGLRYYVHRRPIQTLRRTADIVFPRLRLAVFVDGCFWHSCPQHKTQPKTNGAWWQAKLDRNAERDRETDLYLVTHGWATVRIWEHELPDRAADEVEAAVRLLGSTH
jgi:DNA mismatch endonuclease Vsr